jgi:hypothetical protein
MVVCALLCAHDETQRTRTGNPMGGMGGGPMDFGRSKSKFQEVPETGVLFSDVAVRACVCVFACGVYSALGDCILLALVTNNLIPLSSTATSPHHNTTRIGLRWRQAGAAGGC